MKRRKAVTSRFKKTKNGKLVFMHPGLRHKLAKKSSKRKRRLSKSASVAPGLVKMYARLMGVR